MKPLNEYYISGDPSSPSSPLATQSQPYQHAQPCQSGRLKVSPIHEIYYEVSGNPKGPPILFVHGGPGGGFSDKDKIYFDPKFYQAIFFDQRGAGKSSPHACLQENDTWCLVDDMERLRRHLGVEEWLLFGGSWGSTLCLSYAVTHPERVKGLILRGVFLLREEELLWFYQKGASMMFPDLWEGFLEPIPEVERGNLMHAYYRRLTGTDPDVRQKCAGAWSKWETSTAKLIHDLDFIAKADDLYWAEAFSRIECHYFVHGGFFPTCNYLLENVHKIRNLPGIIIQGRYDVVCPTKSAWELHRAWPNSKLTIVGNAGHSATEKSIQQKLIEACEFFKTFC
eukprot:Sdes_comp22595_c0_seq1m21019